MSGRLKATANNENLKRAQNYGKKESRFYYRYCDIGVCLNCFDSGTKGSIAFFVG